jgi:hypothetical protein
LGSFRKNYFFEKLKSVAGATFGGWGLRAGFGNRTVSGHLAVLCAWRWWFPARSGGTAYCFQLVSGRNKVGTGVNELYRFQGDCRILGAASCFGQWLSSLRGAGE